MRRVACTASALVLALATAACDLSSKETYEVQGVVENVDPGQRKLRVAHGDIPGLMPAMTMDFDVAGPELLDGLAPGDPVSFTLECEATLMRIIAIRKADPGPPGG